MKSTNPLPKNYYWTWDHSTNWRLDAAQQQERGCNNLYTKTADDFIADYRLLTDHCVRTRVGGIVIWGFCRDAHGGVEASREVCNYANARGIRIMPGVGTSVYGGVYYVTDHDTDAAANPLTAKTFVANNPEAGLITDAGEISKLYPCPTHPRTVEWLRECARWLFGTFRIGGVNLEHGDFFICHCERCTVARKGQRQAADFSTMELANKPFIDEALRLQPDAWITYATYTGFAPAAEPDPNQNSPDFCPTTDTWHLRGKNPEFAERIDARAICQWTLTGMVHSQSVPLREWLDDGKPATMFQNDHWPNAIKPPTSRSVGYLHQGSQWTTHGPHLDGMHGRYSLQLSCIKEACLRAVEAGLEGISINGEVSSRCIPCELNYLALSFFSQNPEASLREFGRVCLGPMLVGETEGSRFVEWLANAESGGCSADELAEIDWRIKEALRANAVRGVDVTASRYWQWLRVAAAPGQWNAAQVYQVSA